MSIYSGMPASALDAEHRKLQEEYRGFQSRALRLDMSRGKPGAVQMELTMGLLDTVNSAAGAFARNGLDCRNYGVLDGIPEAKELMAGLLGVEPDELIVGGNSSLNLMYDAVARAMTHGVPGSDKPWCMSPELKFLCPSPGYDRHFAICQHFGIKMVTIDMTPDGPNMDQVEAYVNGDDTVKGIWCVPKYSNPQGITYSKATVERFARLRPAAGDFRIFWDNAYAIHDLAEDGGEELEDLFALLKAQGKEDMIYIFGSTSKISFPGAGLAAVAASERNIKDILASMSVQTIGHSKLNQLAHARFFGDYAGMKAHLIKHAAILRPKFAIVLDTLRERLGGLDIAWWNEPKGGYFISLDVEDGCARRTVELCRQAGVILTGAGATYPYGVDPRDRNIRIAPTFPPEEELQTAAELLCLCVRLAVVEKLLNQR